MKRIGGQALFSGVLMRCGGKISTATLQPDGRIAVSSNYNAKRANRRRSQIPLLRGIAALGESAVISWKTAKKSGWVKPVLLILLYAAVSLGMGYLIDLGMAGVHFSCYLAENLCWSGFFLGEIFLLMLLCRWIAPIHRLFGYHAAEHMTINCYEQNLPLTLENVRKCSRIHPRCGTNLAVNCILLVLIFEIALPPLKNDFLYYMIDLVGTLLLFGIAYEGMRYAEKHDNALSRIIGFFGGLVQRHITTCPPTDEMIACGIAAAEEAMKEP